MGLTSSSTGNKAARDFSIELKDKQDKIVALAGNPNVGKSTVFNALTGMNQHTGNWPGKTVENAVGYCRTAENSYAFVDIPGTYSLMAHSTEEEIARDFICSGVPDATVVVCDATCLERNLNLCLQALEISNNIVICVNLLDEAKRKGITVDTNKLSQRLGVSVVGTVARKKKSLEALMTALDDVVSKQNENTKILVKYPAELEQAIAMIEPSVKKFCNAKISSRWLSLKLLEGDRSLLSTVQKTVGCDAFENETFLNTLETAREFLKSQGIDREKLEDIVVSALVKKSETLCDGVERKSKSKYGELDRKIDKVLTGKKCAYPIMVLLLLFVFWLTIVGANYPSELLSRLFFWIQNYLTKGFEYIGAPDWLHGILVLGMYRVLAWVVSVMLPPMAIFFPLFTLLEDVGFLPRIAYNLDSSFKRCNACGKQALTMAMGFGCNAAGVIGCRIIDSPRERLLAILTNSFVPCNGRFPAIISIIGMFFIGSLTGLFSSIMSALILTAVILVGIVMTFAVTRFLSKTLLKGMPSSFTLEMPPFRRPQLVKVMVRSLFDRTAFVLGRAVTVAAPAGIVIWLMANVTVGSQTVLSITANFLDPFARLLGLDGVILMAFILGFSANETVIPIMLMTYTAKGTIFELDSLEAMKQIFLQNGWTTVTAVCTVLFFLLHWPCSTTLMTVKKETGSVKWTFLAAVLPTAVGIVTCFLVASVLKLIT